MVLVGLVGIYWPPGSSVVGTVGLDSINNQRIFSNGVVPVSHGLG